RKRNPQRAPAQSGLRQRGQPPYELQFVATRLDGCLTATLNLGEQATPVAGDHRVEVVDRRVHAYGRARCSVDHRSIGDQRALKPLEHPPSDGMRVST